MAKTDSQKSTPATSTPVTFKWGAFCRQILSSPADPNEPSLIGLLRGLNFNINVPKGTKEIEVPLVIWVFANFDHQEVTEEKVIKVTAMISLTGRETKAVQEIEMKLMPGKAHFAVNLQLVLSQQGGALLLRPGKQVLKVSFRYQKTDLGKIELPLHTIFTEIPD
jgi:hypothetical protein